MDATSRRRRADVRGLAWLFGLGLGISLIMLVRAQVAGDALAMLTRGWLLAEKGIWVPFGNPVATSTGGFVPGGLTALVVGFPLALWMDHRAPVVLILVCHVVAYLLLDRLVGETLGPRARVVLAIVYWLNPWRLYQSAWLDNSNYVFLTGAIHVWTCYRQRVRPSWFQSALLVAALGFTAQLHLDAALLAIAAVLLWLRGYWKPHWGGVGVGVLITLAPLVPFMLEAFRHPEIIPGGSGDPAGTSLLLVWPLFKGMVYWVRYASLAASHGMNVYDFGPSFGASADAVLTPLFYRLGRGLAWITLVPALLANFWSLRRHRERSRRVPPGAMSDRDWLRGYAVWVFVACVIANALSPTVIMWWHNLIAVHAAVLPLVLWTDALLRTPHGPLVRKGLAAWAAFSVVLLLGMAFGSEQYRRGGREPRHWVLHRNDQVVRDLRLTEYGVSVDPEHGAWPVNNGYLYENYLRPFELPPPPSEEASNPPP